MLSNKSFVKLLAGLVAAGTSTLTYTFDRLGYDAFRVLLIWGVVVDTCTMGLKIGQGDLSNGSDAVDISGSALTQTASTSSGQLWDIDCAQATKRYITVTVTRGTANATLQALIADMYKAHLEPVATTNLTKHVQVFGS